MMNYADALNRALDAVRSGEAIEDVLARMPQYAERLRADVRLTEAVANLSTMLAPPYDRARDDAESHLLTQLEANRAAATTPGQLTWQRRLRVDGWPRLAAMGAALLALVVVAFGLIDGRNGASVEAATLEGVVIENDGGTITIQTLEGLEEIMVPADTPASDVANVRIDVAGISLGEVIVIEVERNAAGVVAKRIERLGDSLDEWCSDGPARCRALSEQLDVAASRCQREPATCHGLLERLQELRSRAIDVAHLEELRARCRAGAPAACEALVGFCRDHSAICRGVQLPVLPVDDRDFRDRARELMRSCRAGDEDACHQLARLCRAHSELCPTDTARPEPSLAPHRPVEPTATPRPTSTSTPRPPTDRTHDATSTPRPPTEPTHDDASTPHVPEPVGTPERDEPAPSDDRSDGVN